MIKEIILTLSLIFISSCSTLNKSILLEASTGAIGGAYIGKFFSKEYQSSTEVEILAGLLFGVAGGGTFFIKNQKKEMRKSLWERR